MFILGMVEGTIPHSGAADEHELANEAALLYFGMTPAWDLVYLPRAATDKRAELRPSRFLVSLRDNCDEMDSEVPAATS